MGVLDTEVATGGRGVRCELRAPTPPRLHVAQVRLVSRLLDSDAGLITVSAPAGAAGTSLLASWAAVLEVADRVAWLSLDHHDMTATRMWEVLLETRGSLPSLSDEHAIRRLRVPIGEIEDRFAERVMASLAPLGAPFWLVLDDLHSVVSPAARACSRASWTDVRSSAAWCW